MYILVCQIRYLDMERWGCGFIVHVYRLIPHPPAHYWNKKENSPLKEAEWRGHCVTGTQACSATMLISFKLKGEVSLLLGWRYRDKIKGGRMQVAWGEP